MTSSSRVAERLAVLLLLVVGSASARAADDPPAPSEVVATPSEDIVVFGDLEVAHRRAALDMDLRQLGYQKGKRKDDHVVYRPVVAWHPTVVVYDDGFVVMKRNNVRFGVPKGVNPWWNLVCPLAPHVCIRPGGQVVSPRRLGQAKGRVAEAVRPDADAWRTAVMSRAMDQRVNEEVPGQLDGLWLNGQAMQPGDPAVPDPKGRREAILEFWASRSCTPEGDRVADVAAMFIEREVQESPFPATADELRAANAASTCGRALDVAERQAAAVDSEATQGVPAGP